MIEIPRKTLFKGTGWKERTKLKGFVVHCTDTECGPRQTELQHIQAINKGHTGPNNSISKDPCPSIVYHWVVGENGIYKCVDEKYITWHCRGLNSDRIGIALIYKNSPVIPPSDKLLDNLEALLVNRFQYYNFDPAKLNTTIIGHREVNMLVSLFGLSGSFKTFKDCPGKLTNMDEIREDIKKQLTLKKGVV